MKSSKQPSWHPNLVLGVAQALRDIFYGGYYADKVLERTFLKNKKWGKRDRQFVAETVYDMVRWWQTLHKFCGGEWAPGGIDDYVVRWVYFEAWKKGQEGGVEFALERLNLEPESVEDVQKKLSKDLDLASEVSFPSWMVEVFKKDYGSEAKELMLSLNTKPPVVLRTNTLKGDRVKLEKQLVQEGINVREGELSPEALVLKERQNVFKTEAFKEGLFEVQDEASQLVAPLLDPQPGERIADVCAGAGGKALHLAALMGNKGTLLAGDVSERKLGELKKRSRRAGISNINIQHFESRKSIKKHFGKFDRVLIDAPCSGSGVIRRNPDTKWKMTSLELQKIIQLQQEILTDYSRFLKPGGTLVYATCSLFRSENEDQVKWFLNHNPDFELCGKPLKTSPLNKSLDGFYAQRFTKI